MAGLDANTKLYVRFNEGPNGATNSDDQTGRHTENFVGTAQLSTAQKAYAADTSSLLLDGNSDYISFDDSSDWDIVADKTTDYTIDFWCKYSSSPSGTTTMVEQGENDTNYWRIERQDTGLYFYCYNGSTIAPNTGAGTTISDTDWHHIALVKKGGASAAEWALYKDGNQINYTSSSAQLNFTGTMFIGARRIPSNYFPGYIAHVRFQASNIFLAAPNVGKTNTITVPTAEYTSLTSTWKAKILCY